MAIKYAQAHTRNKPQLFTIPIQVPITQTINSNLYNQSMLQSSQLSHNNLESIEKNNQQRIYNHIIIHIDKL